MSEDNGTLNNVLDFDAAMAEMGAKTITVMLFGEEWQIPGELPALIPLKVMRLQREQGGDADLSREDTIEMATALFGEANLDEWLRRGITMDQLAKFTTLILMKHHGRLPAGNRQTRRAKPKTTARRASTSSKTGPRSKQTS